jgi:hypothetical protein
MSHNKAHRSARAAPTLAPLENGPQRHYITGNESTGSSRLQRVESGRRNGCGSRLSFFPAGKEDSTKPHRFDPIEVLRSHQTALQERIEGAVDPKQKQLLEKRLRNLDGVIQFLTTTRPAVDGAESQAKPNEALAAVKRAPTKSSPHGKEMKQQLWRLPMGTDCGSV